ncbi:hypothetical protein JCM5350_006208 [Sporobolomyces pararoseus]
MTAQTVEAARVAAASGEMVEMAALRVVGPVYDGMYYASGLHTTVAPKKPIMYGQVVLAVMLDEDWIKEVNDELKDTDERGFANQFKGMAILSLDDVHKGTWNMVKRWLGNSTFESFGASEALDDQGLAEVREVMSKAARAEGPTDLTDEFNSHENPVIREACFSLNQDQLTRHFNPSAGDYDSEADWTYEPDFSHHWLSFDKIINFLCESTDNAVLKWRLENISEEDYKLACEAFVEEMEVDSA